MPLTVAQVLDPRGPIQPEWFPTEGDGSVGTALHTRLTAWIAEAEAKPALVNAPVANDATMKWVEYRAYKYLAGKGAGAAVTGGNVTRVDIKDSVSYTLGEGGSSSSSGGLDFGREARYALQGWRILTAPPAVFLPATWEFRRLLP